MEQLPNDIINIIKDFILFRPKTKAELPPEEHQIGQPT